MSFGNCWGEGLERSEAERATGRPREEASDFVQISPAALSMRVGLRSEIVRCALH
jgi:hypothetical protein